MVFSGLVIANDIDIQRAQTLAHQCMKVPSGSIGITCLDGKISDANCFCLSFVGISIGCTQPHARAEIEEIRLDRQTSISSSSES